MKTTKGQRVKNSTKKTEDTAEKTDQIDDGVQGMQFKSGHLYIQCLAKQTDFLGFFIQNTNTS